MKRLLAARKLFIAALREIFDESAYDRFLRRTNSQSSADAYKAFCRERESAQVRRARCC
ncbi:MAG TPA: hypothetical protein VMH04_16365 [Candidatus Solibacter sp.]|nr:hypothetical protein [Candidatus Solibacter sp.]